MKNQIVYILLVLAPMLAGVCLADSHKHLPLITLPDDDSRDYWLPSQVNTEPQSVNTEPQSETFVGIVNSSVSSELRKLMAKQDKINIALIYPRLP